MLKGSIMTVIEQPITSATADAVGRALFGHVIDSELVPSIDGATMDIVDPSTGSAIATAAAGSAADVDRRRPVGPRGLR